MIRVSGKGRRQTVLPLTQEVGDALAAYIKDHRPQADTDAVFVRSSAPYRAFADSNAISILVARAMRRTGIPLSGVPAADSGPIAATILARNLTDARGIVLRIRQGYQCKLALAAVATWEAGKPKPITTRVRVKGKIVVHTKIPAYRPKPPVPGYCSTLQGVTG